MALALSPQEPPVVMITGQAGTGKSTLVREIAEMAGSVVLAPTGIAALTVRGQTIHSFFRLPPHIINPDEPQSQPGRHHIYQNLERIIIDEISMVRADLLDAVDRSLRINRRNSTPFGGVKIILVGDLLQLPPVVKRAEADILAGLGYKTPYIVSAKVLHEVKPGFVKLSTVYRQDDERFIQMLADLRVGHNVESVINALNAECCGAHRRPVTPVILTATNNLADSHNQAKMSALPGPIYTYTGIIQGQFNQGRGNLEDKLPVPLHLVLKVGARVIMVKNDPGHRWVNGSLATVARTTPNNIWVRLDGQPNECEVNREKWDKVEYRLNEAKSRIVPEVVGSYTQMPLKVAWAITIHKAQGLTLEDVRVDLQTGAFASGQAYVAVSRAKSLAGLSLAHPLAVADVRVDPFLSEVDAEITRTATIWTAGQASHSSGVAGSTRGERSSGTIGNRGSEEKV